MNKYLLTTVCDNGYALGAQVMIYSISKNLKNFDQCDVKVYYNNNIAPLSEKNKNIFRALGKNIILEHVDETKYIDAKVPYHQGREEGSKAAYLTLESFNETNYDKVIMFDVDMLCIKDFSELFTSDYELGIFNRNTGFVVLGKSIRTPEVYNSLISNIKGHNGDFMDQGLIGRILGHLFEPLPSIYNEYKPIWAFDENTRILHWAHFDYVKPWTLEEYKEYNLFENLERRKHSLPKPDTIPFLKDKPAYDLWNQYKNQMYNEFNLK